MKKMQPKSVHLVVTSPPYFNARNYSKFATYEEYLDFIENVSGEVYRLLKPGRYFIINTSPVLKPRTNRAHYSKRFAIPFDIHPRICSKNFNFIDDIIWKKPNGSVNNRNYNFYKSRKPLLYKAGTLTEYVMVYQKPIKNLMDMYLEYDPDIIRKSLVTEEYERYNIWEITGVSSKKHPAVFPEKLVENIIKYYSLINDVVLDPFVGSGTSVRVANRLKRRGVGIEIHTKYVNNHSLDEMW